MTTGWIIFLALDMILNIINFILVCKLGIAFFRYTKIMADPKMRRERQQMEKWLSEKPLI